jgi:hypothetical protein
MRYRPLALALPLAWVACFSSNNAAPPGQDASDDAQSDVTTPDAPPTEEASPEASPTPDQTAPPVEASVDSPAETSPPLDAPLEATLDATVDAPEASIDAPPSVLTVVVGGPSGYEAGIPIVWHDVNGAVLGTATTDSTGSATTTAPTVTMVTALLGTPTQSYPYTVMGVQPGSTVLVADEATFLATYLDVPTSVTSVPTSPTFTESGETVEPQFEVYAGGCEAGGFGPPPMDLDVYQSCLGLAPVGTSFGAGFPLLVEAEDPSGLPLGFAFSKNNDLAALGDAAELDLAIGGSWSTDLSQQTVTLPIGYEGAPVSYSEVSNGSLLSLSLNDKSVVTDAGTVPKELVYTHVGFADQVQIEQVGGTNLAMGFAGYAYGVVAPAPTADGTVALDPTSVTNAPSFRSSSVDWTNPAQPAVSWVVGAGSTLDPSSVTALITLVSWSATLDGGQQSGTWTIVSPGLSADLLTAPALPSALGAYGPQPDAGSVNTTTIAITGLTAFPTYASFLPSASLFQQSANLCSINAPFFPPLARLGTLYASIFTDEGGC